MADIFTVKDGNGKEFSIDVSKIFDLNEDLVPGMPGTAQDSSKIFQLTKGVHDVEFVDQDGKAVDSLQILKDLKSDNSDVIALDVELEATHSGRNHNYAIYYSDSMENDVETFLLPFKKPMLKNHNEYNGEPVGRVISASHGESRLTDERSAITLVARVTDRDAMMKFLDGRYSTFSIGGKIGTCVCNVCGKTILKDGKFKWCGHYKGETYKDQVCYWGMKDLTYNEISVVNNPADDFAQIMKVTVVKGSSDTIKQSKEDSNMDGQTNSTENARKNVMDAIDELLQLSVQDSSANAPQAQTEGSEPQVQDSQPSAQDGANGDTEQAERIKDLESQLKDAQAKLAQAETDLANSKKETESLKNELKDAREEANSFKDKCIELAKIQKEEVVDSIIKKEIEDGLLKEDEKDARKDVLMSLSMKNLMEKTKTKETSDSSQREEANVQNPTLASEDKHDVDNDRKASMADSNKAKTLDDFADEVVGKLLR
mgnify:CR=1 FL=1